MKLLGISGVSRGMDGVVFLIAIQATKLFKHHMRKGLI
jgi:hypothetical protein